MRLLCFRCIEGQHMKHAHFLFKKIVSDIDSLRYCKVQDSRITEHQVCMKDLKTVIIGGMKSFRASSLKWKSAFWIVKRCF